MMYRWTMSLAMLAMAAPLMAQEPPAAGRLSPGANRVRMNGPGQILNVVISRHARLGLTVDLRSSASDSVGAVVQSVTPGGPAAKAGIRSGDLITRLDGHSLTERGSANVNTGENQSPAGLRLIELAARLAPSDTISVDLLRGKDRRTVRLVTAEDTGETFSRAFGSGPSWTTRLGDSNATYFRTAPPEEMLLRQNLDLERMMVDRAGPSGAVRYKVFFGSPLADLELAPLNDDLGSYFGTTDGVLVIHLPRDSKLGLKSGDVILTVDGRKPSDPGHLMRILQSYDQGESFKLEIMRNHKRETVTGRLGDK